MVIDKIKLVYAKHKRTLKYMKRNNLARKRNEVIPSLPTP